MTVVSFEAPHPDVKGGVSAGSPSLPENALLRKALIDRFLAHYDKKSLVLVCAAAGYGKTVLLGQFWKALEGRASKRIWVSLTGGDADPQQFVETLINACNLGGEEALRLVSAARRAPGAALAGLAQRLGGDAVLFIDEYQNVQSEETDQLLRGFFQQTPKAPTVVLAARSEPECGVAKMRLGDAVAEYGHEDLAFTFADVNALFADAALSQTDIDALYEKTKGWPAALRFAKRWVVDNHIARGRCADFAGDLPIISSYIMEEVFAAFPENARRFLCAASILPYIGADAADAALSRCDSEQMIRRLEGVNAFFVAVDSSPGRYDLHPLFADFLRARLYETAGEEAIRKLHRNAAAYFDERRDCLSAIEHALQAEDDERIDKVMGRPEFGLLWLSVDYSAFMRVMSRIERRYLDGNEDLNDIVRLRLELCQAFYFLKAGRFDDVKATLDTVGPRLDAVSADLGEDAILRYAAVDFFLMDATYRMYADKGDVGDLIVKIEAKLRDNDIAHPMYLGVLGNILGMLRSRLGRVDEAMQSFEVSIEKFEQARSVYSVVYGKIHLSALFMLKADFKGARKLVDEARVLCNTRLSGERRLSTIIDISLAERLYEEGDLDKAASILPAALAAYITDEDCWVELLNVGFRVGSILQYRDAGLDVALSLLGQGLEVARTYNFDRLRKSLTAQKIHLAASAGQIATARRFANEAGYSLKSLAFDPKAFGWREQALLGFALIRLEIEARNPEDALEALDRFDAVYGQTDFLKLTLKAKALRALALFVDGQLQEASALLRILIDDDKQRGAMSFFLEEGALAQQLLDETARRFQRSKKVDGFNNLLREWLIASSGYLPASQRLQPLTLTEQQKRILRLLARGLDRQAIADEAQTTIFNVQYHLKKLFELFGVASSTRLAAEAIRLDIADAR